MTVKVDYFSIASPGSCLLPEAFEALNRLCQAEPVFVHTDFRPGEVALRLQQASGFTTLFVTRSALKAFREPFWDTKGTVLVTNRDLPHRAHLALGQVTIANVVELLKG